MNPAALIAGLEGKYRQSSGVTQLKIKHNGVLGYFIEVSQQHADKLMADKETFRHRQTMAGAVRFSTDELASLASRIAEAGEAALALEAALFDEMAMLAHRTWRGAVGDRRCAGQCWMLRRRWANWPLPRAMCGRRWMAG